MNNSIPLKENQDSKCPNCNSDQLEKETSLQKIYSMETEESYLEVKEKLKIIETGWIVCNNCRLRFFEGEVER